MNAQAGSVALVTSTYRGDLDRCRLLCDSIDARASGHTAHYLLVEERDRELFAPLAGPRRHVVGESDLLPRWLRSVADPLSPSRRLWLHPFGLPLRGWHAQQLRRIAFAGQMAEAAMLSCDSDVVFVKDFDARSLFDGERLRFYRVPDGIDAVDEGREREHVDWSRRAGRLLGLDALETRTGYITTLVPWRGDTVREMLARIETTTKRSAMRALAASRALSECTIYGRFVEEAENRPDRHAPTDRPLARVRWAGAALDSREIEGLLDAMAPQEAALCIQSFIGTDTALIRRAAGLG